MLKKLLILPAAFLAFACSNGDKKVDDALNSDLSTAAQATPYQPLDSITAAERAAAAAPVSNLTSTRTSTAAPVRRTTTARRTSSRSSSSSNGGGSYSSQPVYSAPAPRQPTVVKHTKRDAAIGAGAGAIIGAVTSKNKVKGAIIGGAAGAILGGVIGNNVDKTKKY
ncbi:MAG TPA: YMGG-like glycine zipper-containing protein [Gemmatimonadaceae bacterium]|nr:YMGG-like glycine zipper-containing protein [Gemmatimonadaceae bacterium]